MLWRGYCRLPSHQILPSYFTGEVIESNGGSEFRWARELEERNRLWKARHDTYYASLALIPGCKVQILNYF